MSDKRVIRQQIHRLNRIKTWQLIVVFILMLILSATFLRLNNIGMMERRDAVISADKSGDEYAIQNRVADLQRYASTRMNASTGPVYLSEQYKRDIEAMTEERRRQAAAGGGETIFSRADAICKQRFVGYSQAYVQCVANEIAAMPNTVDPTQEIEFPSAALYKYEFVSPGWSPDFAGFSVLVTAALGVLIVVRAITKFVLLRLVKRHYRSL